MTLPEPYYDRDGITIYHADCMDVLPHLPKVDLVLTDPPYGIGIAANPVRQRHSKSKWDDDPATPSAINAAVAGGDSAIVWGGNYFHLPPSQMFLVWDKCQPEALTLAMVEQAWCSFSGPAKMIRYRVAGSYHKSHPTQKPVPVMKWCIQRAPQPVESILDPFMGSGTTLIAARDMGCRAIGIEIEEKYCEIAVKRLAQGVLF